MGANAPQVVLLVGTQKGLFRFSSDLRREYWEIEGPYIRGYEVAHAWLDPRKLQVGFAATSHAVWGTHIYRSEDGGRTWSSLSRVPCHPEGRPSLRSVWYLAPGHAANSRVIYAGIDPPGVFVSEDLGERWSPLVGLNQHPTRETWQPARGAFAAHSINVDPVDINRIYAAVSAGGAYRSDDGGQTWNPINCGVRAENLPHSAPETGHNIHRLVLHPRRPERLYRQCYNGTYRSDDHGDTWIEITAGLPSDFGYAITSGPQDPDTVFVIPEEGAHMRAAVGGKLRVYRSGNAGENWEALCCGLPQENAYVSVLREAMCTDDLDPCGVYFGTSGGHLFASRDNGDDWKLIAGFLPRVLSITSIVAAG